MPAKKEKKACVIGRFQPLHRGHLTVLTDALDEFDFIFVAIGSSHISRTPENPFTVGERHAMVKDALIEAGIEQSRFKVVPLPDIDEEEKWPKYVVDTVGQFDAVVSGNSRVKELFEKKTKKKVIVPKKKYAIEGKMVREALAKGEEMKKYIPDAVMAFLQKIGAARKILDIQEEAAAAESEA